MTMLWIMTVAAVLVAGFALLHSIRLRKEVNQLKHQQFESRGLLKRMEEDFSAAIQPIRFHLAKIASGGAVSPELVLSGKAFRELSGEQVLEKMRQVQEQGGSPFVVIDVRTRREFAERRLPQATLVPFEDLDRLYESLIPEQAERVLVYCSAGERSRMACEYLSQKGYTNLFHLREGLQGWSGSTEGEGPMTPLIQIDKKPVSSLQ